MRKKYIRPAIEVIAQPYGEGVMQTLSLGISTNPTTHTGDSKPTGEWGDTWVDSNANDDYWGME